MGKIPWQSLPVGAAGLGLMALAAMLGLSPWFRAVGIGSGAVMLLGGGMAAGVRLPAEVRAAGAATAAIAAFHALRPAPVPVLWAAGVALTCLEARAATAEWFDLSRALLGGGARRWVALGALVCFASLLLGWGRGSGHWSGGYALPAGTGTDPEWSLFYLPGAAVTGQGVGFAPLAEVALAALLAWSAWRGRVGVRTAIVIAGVAGVWWAAHLQAAPGPLVFGAGLAAVGWGLLRQE